MPELSTSGFVGTAGESLPAVTRPICHGRLWPVRPDIDAAYLEQGQQKLSQEVEVGTMPRGMLGQYGPQLSYQGKGENHQIIHILSAGYGFFSVLKC